ncbi:MAG: polyprenyl synthetase family protein [Limnochordia bacterium]|jgi:geranylgeranyl diphosphate synthase type II
MSSDLEKYMQQMAALVEEELDRLLPSESEAPGLIHRAMRYSTCGGGKRLRAMLAMEAAGLRGEPKLRALPVAAGVEMIHAYSLIHDDLPCMDDDDYRRGQPSNHKVFGEGLAVLAGDALLAEAFVVLARLPELIGLSSELTVRVMAQVTEAASTKGLVGGQVADLQAEGADVEDDSADTLRFIHERKTGALFRASLLAGALVGGLDESDLAAVDDYAMHFGLAFQIMDDLLDVIGDAGRLGKAVGSDQRRHKLTYPRLYGVERSKAMALEAVESAKESVRRFGAAADRLVQLAGFVVEREY